MHSSERVLGEQKKPKKGGECSGFNLDQDTTIKACIFHLRQEHPDVNIMFGCKLIGIDEERSEYITEPPLPCNEFDMLFRSDGSNSAVRRFSKSFQCTIPSNSSYQYGCVTSCDKEASTRTKCLCPQVKIQQYNQATFQNCDYV